MSTRTLFRIGDIRRLRRAASEAASPPESCPQGWSISTVDPHGVLDVFEALTLDPDYELRAFQYVSGGDGNGLVHAVPRHLPLARPGECRRGDGFLSPPIPPGALDDLMEAISGDGSPWSYMQASLFAREIGEFGAIWHGCHWIDHEILARHPGDVPESGPWTWQRRPDWVKPHTLEDDGGIAVRFQTTCGAGNDHLTCFVDRYARGSYRFESSHEIVATAPGGFMY